jgi:hypothetical protein
MEDACNLCNVIEFFSQKKLTKPKIGRPFGTFKLQMALAQTYPPAYINIQIPPLLKGRIDQQGVNYNNSILWLEPHQSNKFLGGAKSKQ